MQTPEIKDILRWARLVLVFLAVFLAAESFNAFKHWHDINPAYNSITVSGKGEAFAIPDLATFSFSVSADAKTVAEAQSQVTSKMDAILKRLKDLGIEDKDVKTTDYSVYPKYTYGSMAPCSPNYCPPSRQVQDGFTANHSVSVKVRKADDAGKALQAAGDAGATNLSSISFTVDDLDKITTEARAIAIKDAKEKAEALSDELGVHLVRVVSYSDGNDGGPMPYYSERAVAGNMAVDQAKAPTLPTGENKVSVTVNVTYEIR